MMTEFVSGERVTAEHLWQVLADIESPFNPRSLGFYLSFQFFVSAFLKQKSDFVTGFSTEEEEEGFSFYLPLLFFLCASSPPSSISPQSSSWHSTPDPLRPFFFPTIFLSAHL